jgi:hypothetical protein
LKTKIFSSTSSTNKTSQSKQSPNGRKFAQSGQPAPRRVAYPILFGNEIAGKYFKFFKENVFLADFQLVSLACRLPEVEDFEAGGELLGAGGIATRHFVEVSDFINLNFSCIFT